MVGLSTRLELRASADQWRGSRLWWLLASTRAVLALQQRHPELVVLAAHDPAAAGSLAAAVASKKAA